MIIITELARWAIPFILFSVPLYAYFRKVPVYETFVEGAENGFKTAVKILPFLIGMLVSIRIFVDSAPVLDRAWAKRAGLGWIGKNSMLISRKAGSFVFIGELILDLELEYNQVPEGDFCGSCARCIEACPTDAILSNRTLDAQRCVSYQTIENKGDIDAELEGKLSNRFFGCDICQDVCPWNRSPLLHNEPAFIPSEALLRMTRNDWENLNREQYNHLFVQSPVKRAGFNKLKDNIAFIGRDSKK